MQEGSQKVSDGRSREHVWQKKSSENVCALVNAPKLGESPKEPQTKSKPLCFKNLLRTSLSEQLLLTILCETTWAWATKATRVWGSLPSLNLVLSWFKMPINRLPISDNILFTTAVKCMRAWMFIYRRAVMERILSIRSPYFEKRSSTWVSRPLVQTVLENFSFEFAVIYIPCGWTQTQCGLQAFITITEPWSKPTIVVHRKDFQCVTGIFLDHAFGTRCCTDETLINWRHYNFAAVWVEQRTIKV